RLRGFDARALRLLERYAWPGNVRELENEIHRLVLCAEPRERITPDLLAAWIVEGTPPAAGDGTRPLKEIVREVELATIRARLRVLLVDDHTLVRQGLRCILATDEEIEVVGEAGDGRSAVELSERLQPDVVVMDLTLPELNGIEATRRIFKQEKETKVLILTMHTDRMFVR